MPASGRQVLPAAVGLLLTAITACSAPTIGTTAYPRLEARLVSPDQSIVLDPPAATAVPRLSASDAIARCKACSIPSGATSVLGELSDGLKVHAAPHYDRLLVWVVRWQAPCQYEGTANSPVGATRAPHDQCKWVFALNAQAGGLARGFQVRVA
jgi:hypothetical protein